MIRRFNYTGRQRIHRSDATIYLSPDRVGKWEFSTEINLSGYAFPNEARIYVEAYTSSSYMRFDFNTVAGPEAPLERTLTDISPEALPKFRVKVVDQTERHGRLLGVADKLIPVREGDDPSASESLLAVHFHDLGNEVWRLELDDWPELHLNHQIEGIAELARTSGTFIGLVYPEILRRILSEIVLVRNHTDPEDDDEEWTSLWLKYACALGPLDPPPHGENDEARTSQQTWIDHAVQAFANSMDARMRFETSVVKGLS
jgi:hypothetical protein